MRVLIMVIASAVSAALVLPTVSSAGIAAAAVQSQAVERQA